MWTLSFDLGCAPANRVRVCLKRVVWGTVQVKSGRVSCWCEPNWTKSRKWTAINAILFDKMHLHVCLCVFHSLSWRVWLMRCKQKAVGLIYVLFQRSLDNLQYIHRTEVCFMHWSFVNKTNGSKNAESNRMHFTAFSHAIVTKQRGKQTQTICGSDPNKIIWTQPSGGRGGGSNQTRVRTRQSNQVWNNP